MNDDLISRQAVLDILEKEGRKWGNDYRDWVDAIEEIKNLPSVNPQEPKTGHWEWLTEDKYRCSNCNSETKVDECLNEPMYEFCPFCGCPMVGEEV